MGTLSEGLGATRDRSERQHSWLFPQLKAAAALPVVLAFFLRETIMSYLYNLANSRRSVHGCINRVLMILTCI